MRSSSGPGSTPRLTTGCRSSTSRPTLAELDLERAGITTIVWTTGYRLDYGWIDLPIFDELGFPRQVGGVSEAPGLFFLGSLWLRTQASSTLFGVGIDARRLAGAMGLSAVA